jgi:photosystem II stability/assembly factor-like uncharacterized protein
MAPYWRAHRIWRLCLPLAALTLMLAGCGHAEYPGMGAAASATITPEAMKLTWQIASPPPETATMAMFYAPAPSDGRVAYACGFSWVGAATHTVVWSTSDSGRSWSRGVALPYSGQLSYCSLIIDANDPQRVAIWLNTAKIGASPEDKIVVAFLSLDGGTTWRTLPKAGPHVVMNMTSFGGAIYAAGGGLSASGADLRDVWVSRDDGHSWSALGASKLSPNPLIWANPKTGELLGTNNYDLIPTLWRSGDGGASWTHIAAPNVAGAGAQQAFIVAPNVTGWHVCVSGASSLGPNTKNMLACSADLGKTWTKRLALNPTQYSPKGFTFTALADVFAIADDGSLLASYDDITTGMTLEWLAPGASAWTSLGNPPLAGSIAASPFYASGPGKGMLWAATGVSARPFITAVYP